MSTLISWGAMMSPGPEQRLEGFRQYLALLARLQVDPKLQAKVDLSGVVQQTLLEAYQSLQKIDGWNEAQQAAWLRQALANNLKDELRRWRTEARDVGREQSLQAALDQSSTRLEAWLAANQSSPSQRVDRQEQAVRLADALARLPEAQREALVLQHWHGWSLVQIAEHLGRTPAAVAGLLHRGLGQLREHLQESE
ncbi:MAG: sigma-70 family RNA polymerase sigma factor [Planctomycetes bacterium]|nr:sigma-70 family RNA polymerase sigma factor [Planctomycetota bacterium]